MTLIRQGTDLFLENICMLFYHSLTTTTKIVIVGRKTWHIEGGYVMQFNFYIDHNERRVQTKNEKKEIKTTF